MKKKSKHIIDWRIIAKYLANETNKKEDEEIKEWINVSSENESYFNEIKNIWNKTQEIKDYEKINIDLAKKTVKQKIDAKIIELKPGNKTGQKRNKLIIDLLKIAAVFVFGIGIWYTYNQISEPQTQTIASNQEKNTEVRLPDGTIVNLNKNSTLKYPEKFIDNKREISLNGEAFFNVIKNKNKPFIINANGVKIQVLGTSFNVNAYDNSKQVEVIVKSGKVQLSEKNKETNYIVLNAGYKGTFAKENKQLIKTVNANINYLAWKTGILKFQNTKLLEVTKTLEKHYNINVLIKDSKLKDLKLTAKFDNKPLNSVIEILKITFDNIEINKKGRYLVVSSKS